MLARSQPTFPVGVGEPGGFRKRRGFRDTASSSGTENVATVLSLLSCKRITAEAGLDEQCRPVLREPSHWQERVLPPSLPPSRVGRVCPRTHHARFRVTVSRSVRDPPPRRSVFGEVIERAIRRILVQSTVEIEQFSGEHEAKFSKVSKLKHAIGMGALAKKPGTWMKSRSVLPSVEP